MQRLRTLTRKPVCGSLSFDCKARVASLLVVIFAPLVYPWGPSLQLRRDLSNNWCSTTTARRAETPESRSLLEQARKLRREASDLESTLQRQSTNNTVPSIKTKQPVVYSDVRNSTWKVTYRFASQLQTAEVDKERDGDSSPVYYSGSVVLLFRNDRFTEMLSQEARATYGAASPQKSDAQDNQLLISKAWGWDVEASDDGNEYLLFSLDSVLPTTSKDSTLKLYYQARLGRQLDNVITLKEGTITVKQDAMAEVETPFFGLFSPRGILARFVRVGDFIMKPVTAEDSN